MALVVGLIVGFVILLVLKLLGASLRYPQWAAIILLMLDGLMKSIIIGVAALIGVIFAAISMLKLACRPLGLTEY